MTAGFELLIEPAAKGLAALITDTTKTGSSSGGLSSNGTETYAKAKSLASYSLQP